MSDRVLDGFTLQIPHFTTIKDIRGKEMPKRQLYKVISYFKGELNSDKIIMDYITLKLAVKLISVLRAINKQKGSRIIYGYRETKG